MKIQKTIAQISRFTTYVFDVVYRRNGNDRRIKQKIIQPFLSLSQIACDVVCDFYLFLDFYFSDSEFSFSAYSFHFGNFSFKMVATREFSFNRNIDVRLFCSCSISVWASGIFGAMLASPMGTIV